MKNGTMYANRLGKFYAKLRQSAPKPEIPSEPDDPLRRLAIAVLGVASTDAEGEKALERALEAMVDWNEVRVTSAFDLNKATGNTLHQGVARCQNLIDALQSVFDRENQISLDRLTSIGRREAKHYLEELSGIDAYAVASVVLWSLGGHAIPVNDRLLQAMRDADLVRESSDRGEVQAFLERHISSIEAKEFCLIMREFAARTPRGSKRARGKSTSKKKKSVSRAK